MLLDRFLGIACVQKWILLHCLSRHKEKWKWWRVWKNDKYYAVRKLWK